MWKKTLLTILVLGIAFWGKNASALGEIQHCGVLPQKAIASGKLPFSGYNEYFISGAFSEDWYTLGWALGMIDWHCVQSQNFAKKLYELADTQEKKIWALGFAFSNGTDALWGDWCVEENISAGSQKENLFKYAVDVYGKCKQNAARPSSIIYYPELIRKAYKQVCGKDFDTAKIKASVTALLLGTQLEYNSISCSIQGKLLDNPCYCLDKCGLWPCLTCKPWPCSMYKNVKEKTGNKTALAVDRGISYVKEIFSPGQKTPATPIGKELSPSSLGKISLKEIDQEEIYKGLGEMAQSDIKDIKDLIKGEKVSIEEKVKEGGGIELKLQMKEQTQKWQEVLNEIKSTLGRLFKQNNK